MVLQMANSTRRPNWNDLSKKMSTMGYHRSSNSLILRARLLPKPYKFKCVHNLVKSAIRKVIRHRKGIIRRSNWQKTHKLQRQKSSKKWRDKQKSNTEYKERRKAKDKKLRPISRKRENVRYKTDTTFNVTKKMRMRLFNHLSVVNANKKGKTLDLIGCSSRQLKDHLSKQCNGDVKQYNIDHIFALMQHDMTTIDGQKKAMHWSNLQPLTSTENQSKSDKLPTKAMAAKVERWAWPTGITEADLPDIYPGWSTPLRM